MFSQKLHQAAEATVVARTVDKSKSKMKDVLFM